MPTHSRLILASQSPRRLTLLRQVGYAPEVMPCDVPEEFDEQKSSAENARLLAERKARCVAGRVEAGFILGADTIVTLEGTMLGKPADAEDAVRMLSMLSNRTHTVHTGIALLHRPSGALVSAVEETSVTFRFLPHEEIRAYVQGGSPMDKAGAYGIQDDYGAVFVTRIQGCYYNVVGLPLARFHLLYRAFRDQCNNGIG